MREGRREAPTLEVGDTVETQNLEYILKYVRRACGGESEDGDVGEELAEYGETFVIRPVTISKGRSMSEELCEVQT